MPDCAESLCPTKRRPLRPDRVGGLSCNPWNNARRISMECEHRVSAAGELRRAYSDAQRNDARYRQVVTRFCQVVVPEGRAKVGDRAA
jgi:hypothetical protein